MSERTNSDYTMELRLCDDEGMVSHEIAMRLTEPPLTYLGAMNILRARTRPLGEHEPVEEPFHCTGSAHLAGEHIRCTSPAHERLPALPADLHAVLSDQSVIVPQDQAVWELMARRGSAG